MTNLGYSNEEPIAAIATALAPSALGIIRVSGKNSIQLVSQIFSRPKALTEAKGNTIAYGWIVKPASDSASAQSEKIDEVLVSVFRAPKSFTGEDMAEISCHGGVNVVQSVYALLLENGFRPAERGEFTFRAYINGKTDLTKAEAVREIIDSKTAVGRSHAAGRLAGNLYETIDGVKKHIIDTLAAIEVEIEYPEDEETIADSFNSEDLVKAKRILEDLAASWKTEKIYQDGARVVLAGRTNAGKSSLFNALLKEDRAIVSDIEGTTRDFIESLIDFDGIPARLFDTAGLRETSDLVEAVGVERTKDLSSEADLILYLIDATSGISDHDRLFILKYIEDSKLKSLAKPPLIIVWNKADSLSSAEESDSEFEGIVQVKTSAKTGKGIDELCAAIKAKLSYGIETDRTQTGLGSERQKVAVVQALECVEHALSVGKEYALDAVVQDLEDCLDALGTVTGDVTPEDILGSIFSHFCVGK